jgi:hypothetical protein
MTAVPAAPVVLERAGDRAGALLRRAGLSAPPRPVIVVCGGADDLAEPQLTVARRTLGPAVAAAASLTGAVVADGGTAAGVMALLGEQRARDPAAMAVLLGVAPAGKVEHAGAAQEGRTPLDRHHTHVVLADSDEWGGETPLLMALAEQLAQGRPIVMVLAGGGEGTRAELLEGVARGWPLFVIAGTGGVADEVVAALRSDRPPRWGRVGAVGARLSGRLGLGGRRTPPALLRELAGGDVRVVAGDGPEPLGRSLKWELQDEPALKDAWQLFATYDGLAGRLRDSFERFQTLILLLGIAATAIALLSAELHDTGLRWLAIALPIVASVVVALANRRAAGRRWVLLRAAAEALKSEIYRCRTATGVYSQAVLDGAGESARQRLAARLADVESKLVSSDASGGPLTPYCGSLPPVMYGAGADDDGLSGLDASRYIEIRVSDQLAYYRGKVDGLDRVRGRLQVVMLAAGGAGAFLAAVDVAVWVGLSTTVAGAALAYLGYLQFDSTIVAYNQTAAQLATLQRDFRARDGDMPLEELVGRGESVLTRELGGWVQQMTEALEQQRAEQTKAATKVDPEAEKGE